MRTFFNLTAFFGILILCSWNWADEASLKFFKEVDQKIYRPTQKGLNTLSMTITNNTLTQNPLFSKIQAKFYFKDAGKKQKLAISGLETLPEDLKNIPGQVFQIEKQVHYFFQTYINEFLGTSFEKNIEEYESITLKREDDFDRLVLVPKANSYLRQYFNSQTLTCQNQRIVKIETANITGTTSTTNFSYKEKDGQILIDKIDSRVSSSNTSYRYEYQTIEGIFVLQKISGMATNGTPFEVQFVDVKINGEIADQFFQD